MKVLHWNPKTHKTKEVDMPDELAKHALAHKTNVTELGAENPFKKKTQVKKAADASEEAPSKKTQVKKD